MICIDCGSPDVSDPDHEGFIDCFDCGAAWIPGVADEPPVRARDSLFALFMDEIVLRLLMLTPARKRLIAHMDEVRMQDVRLNGKIHPHHQRGWLKP